MPTTRTSVPSELPESDRIDEGAIREALDEVLGESLRSVSVGLGLFYALLSIWFVTRLEGTHLTTLSISCALLSAGFVVAAVWFARNRLPPRLAHPVASTMAVPVIVHCLLLLVLVPQARMTTHLMIAEIGLGCLLLSVPWFLGISAFSLLGWGWVAGARTGDPLWYHFWLALTEATLFGALALLLRIRAYRNVQLLRLRDRRMMERLREASHAALEAARAKSEFLANMSHEIRTPMTAMLGMADLLEMSELDAQQREYASTITRSGQTLLELVNDILDFSKIEAGGLVLEETSFELRQVLDEVRALLGVRARQKGLAFEIEVDPDIPRRYRGDPTRIRQVLLNLVGNAVKFTEKGHVTLAVTAARLDGARHVVAVQVHDTGIGIAAEHFERLFEAFAQADASTTRRFGGTGLGLAISQQLVRRMGGDIKVESEVTRGSTFTATFMLKDDVAEARGVAPES